MGERVPSSARSRSCSTASEILLSCNYEGGSLNKIPHLDRSYQSCLILDLYYNFMRTYFPQRMLKTWELFDPASMSRPSEKVKAHGRCHPHLLGSCLKASGDGLLLL